MALAPTLQEPRQAFLVANQHFGRGVAQRKVHFLGSFTDTREHHLCRIATGGNDPAQFAADEPGAVEAEQASHLACKSAGARTGGSVLALHRDLFRAPLQPAELNRFDAVRRREQLDAGVADMLRNTYI